MVLLLALPPVRSTLCALYTATVVSLSHALVVCLHLGSGLGRMALLGAVNFVILIVLHQQGMPRGEIEVLFVEQTVPPAIVLHERSLLFVVQLLDLLFEGESLRLICGCVLVPFFSILGLVLCLDQGFGFVVHLVFFGVLLHRGVFVRSVHRIRPEDERALHREGPVGHLLRWV